MKTLKDSVERAIHIHNLELLLNEDLIKNNDILFEAINFAIEELRIPTADEVCKVLRDYFVREVKYTSKDKGKEGFHFNDDGMYIAFLEKELEFYEELPPNLIKFIARFYEGVIE